MGKLRDKLPFAEGGVVTKILNDTILSLLGPKTEADDKMRADKLKEDKKKNDGKIPTNLHLAISQF